jgi:hypothetical protein
MLVEELRSPRDWEDFLKDTSGGTFFHSIEWKNVIEKSFPYSTVYFEAKNENGKIIGIYPAFIATVNNLRVLDSLPLSDFGGPVIEKKYVKEVSFSMRKFAEDLCYEKDVSCSRILLLNGSCEFFRTRHCYINEDCFGIVESDLKEKPPAFIWEKVVRTETRKKIKRFEKDNFQVREASAKSDLRTFWALYRQNMKHIDAIARPFTFFENMWDLLFPENFNILLIEKSKAVGGIAFFIYNGKIYLTFMGIDRESLSSKYRVAPLLYWSAIKWAAENGLRYVCFGSTAARPKTAAEKTSYSQKMMFGGSFVSQEMMLIPFSTRAWLMSKAMRLCYNARNLLPPHLWEWATAIRSLLEPHMLL